MSLSLEAFKSDPKVRALAVCLDALVRMDPDAVSAHRLRQCTDAEFNNAVEEAACFLWGADRKVWPADVQTVLAKGMR